MSEPARVSENRTPRYCIHPYFGFVCTPNSVQDFGDSVPGLGRPAIAHIDAWGFRNREFPERKPDDEVWIGLFGGSVAFSVPSSSNETTVSGYLEAELNKTPRRKKVRVINFAVPAGQQPQSLIIFGVHLNRLDGAIVFDGVNEAIVPAYYNRNALPPTFPYRPFYEALFTRSLSDEQRALQWSLEQEERALQSPPAVSWWQRSTATALQRERVERLRQRLRETASESSSLESIFPRVEGGNETFIAIGLDNWRDSTRSMHALAQSAGIPIASILQPMPERQKALTDRERQHLESQPEVVRIREQAYARLTELSRLLEQQSVPVVDFADVFADCRDDMYADIGHFTDQGCLVVARKIAAEVSKWACLAAK